MGRRNGRWMGLLLLAGVLSGALCFCRSLSAGAKTAVFCYETERGKKGETDRLMEAVDMCKKYGGTLTVKGDQNVMGQDYGGFIYLPHNVTVIVPAGVCLTLKGVELWMEGTAKITGILDASDPGARVSGSGTLITEEGGRFRRHIPYIEKTGDLCLQGEDIESGQSLSCSAVAADRIYWKASVEGEWSFTQQEWIPEIGTRTYDVTFTPSDLRLNEPVTLPRCGQVTVRERRLPPDTGNTPDVSIPTPGAGIPEPASKPEGEGKREPVIITRMVSKPSLIYRRVTRFSQRKIRIRKLKRQKKGRRAYVRWTPAAGAGAYELQYAAVRSMKRAKKRRTRRNNITIGGLSGRAYYFRVRGYRQKNGRRTFTKWSSVRKG